MLNEFFIEIQIPELENRFDEAAAFIEAYYPESVRCQKVGYAEEGIAGIVIRHLMLFPGKWNSHEKMTSGF